MLLCLLELGGAAALDDLTDKYNKMHFPRNVNYTYLSTNDVKKTQQGDIAKLLRDNLISRVYKKPKERDPYDTDTKKQFRKYGYYTITTLGYKYIVDHRLHTLQQMQRMRD